MLLGYTDMEGLSDDSFSDVELKETSFARNGQDENLINTSVDVVTTLPNKTKKKVTFKAVGKAVAKFLGVPEETSTADNDDSNPKVSLSPYQRTYHCPTI